VDVTADSALPVLLLCHLALPVDLTDVFTTSVEVARFTDIDHPGLA
jgi:hypothetical protein